MLVVKATDLLISALVENGVEPFFRLGVTIENQCKVKADYIYPPKDYEKWAIVCEHIIRHYNEGWANGFHYNIRYWEIWNEPDNEEDPADNQMWRGNKEEYYELYKIVSFHLKKCFPHLKIGGYACCGFYFTRNSYTKLAASSERTEYFIEFFDGFIDFIKKHNCPFDFFSWHSYDDLENTRHYARYARRRLDEAGFDRTEMSCNEWTILTDQKGRCSQAAAICAMLIMMQEEPIDTAMFYDARLGVSEFGSLFNALYKTPYPAYYAFTAFNRLYKLGNCAHISIEPCDDVYGAAASDGKSGCVVIVNCSDEAIPFSLDINGVVRRCLITQEGCSDDEIRVPSKLPPSSIITLEVDIC